MSLKILIVGQTPPPVHGSNIMTETFIQSLEHIGHEVQLVERKFSKKQEDMGKIALSKICRAPIVAYTLFKKIVQNDFDICFYILSLKPPSFHFDAFILHLIKWLNLRYIIYLHGKGLSRYVIKSDRITMLMARKLLSDTFGFIIVGNILRKEIRDLIGEEKIFLLPNAIADIKCYKQKEIISQNQLVPILFLSNLRPSKGVMEFLKMACEVRKKCNNGRFILAGPARSKKIFRNINSFLSQNNLKRYFSLPVAVSSSEKQKIFRNSDIFVFPSKKEAFGLVNLEAMQYSLPVVASNQGAIPQIVRHGESGYIVDPSDIKQIVEKVVLLVKNPQLRMKMGKRGRMIYEENFNIEAYTRKVKEAIDFFKLLSV
jgi:glycosyltransferase involved in cell wall biosynthesis